MKYEKLGTLAVICLYNDSTISLRLGNVKEKPALCEQQSLLAANEEKEWVMSELCIMELMLLHEKRVLPFPNLPR